MSIIVLLVMSLNALSLKWFNARLRYAVWLVILVGLLIPFRPAIGGGLISVPDATAPGQAAVHSELGLSPFFMFIILWGVVAVAIFSYHIWRYLRFTRLMRHWGKAVEDEKILEIFQSVKRDNGLKNVEIGLMQCKMQCDFINTSLLTGFLKPVVLLPAKHFEADELEMIFRHELIHYKRKDLLVKLLSVIAISMHWFNPIIYWLCNAIQTESEASCDEAVILEIGEENRRYYAELIIEMVGSKTTMLSTCFYGGKKSLKRRLDSIMDTTKELKRPAYATFAAIVMITIMSGSVFAFSINEFNDGTSETILEFTEYEIEPEQAKEIALTTVGGGTIVSAVLSENVYFIKVLLGDKQYEIDINAVDGAIISYHPTAIDSAVTPNSETINNPISGNLTMEEAAQIAIDAVGGGTVEKVEYEYKNGQSIFEVKTRHNGVKYEVYVDGTTGEVIRLK
jgi:beta-lactamase regulating signal transducer with metallopeptidase domain